MKHPTVRYGAGRRRILFRVEIVLLAVLLTATACSSDDSTETSPGGTITVYSGRSENLIGPLLEQFSQTTGIGVEVRYGESADLALLIDTEGDRSPADVFISQSPGAMSFLAEKNRLLPIDRNLLDLVEPAFRSAQGSWVGITGRVRVLVYNPELIDPTQIPTTVFGLTQERFRGKVGVAPTNGSFQDFVTAMRQVHGDATTLQWLQDLADNQVRPYPKNSAIVQAVGRGEVELGLVNHYYNFRAKAEDPDVASENFYLPEGDVGSLLIVTAAGVVDTAEDPGRVAELIRFLLDSWAQTFFAQETSEYPLAAGAVPSAQLPPLSSIGHTTYDFDRLGGGLKRTKEIIDESGIESA